MLRFGSSNCSNFFINDLELVIRTSGDLGDFDYLALSFYVEPDGEI
jgi:hypothetical protein